MLRILQDIGSQKSLTPAGQLFTMLSRVIFPAFIEIPNHNEGFLAELHFCPLSIAPPKC